MRVFLRKLFRSDLEIVMGSCVYTPEIGKWSEDFVAFNRKGLSLNVVCVYVIMLLK